MIAHRSNHVTLRISRSQKVVGIIGGVCVAVILATVIVYLSGQPDFSMFTSYLSDVRVTPAWPQIGLLPTPIH